MGRRTAVCYPARVDIIDVRVQMRDDADIAATLEVDLDQRLSVELEVLPTQIMLGLLVPVVTDGNVFATNTRGD
jgi:hypothetical protein